MKKSYNIEKKEYSILTKTKDIEKRNLIFPYFTPSLNF